jgi:polyphosphate kinase 2 (PPK2 family)
MKTKDVPENRQSDMDEAAAGSTKKIRDTLEKVESEVTCVTPDKRLRKILKVLKKKEKEDIVKAVLEKFYNSEELKPYQAELIKMQRHLERTGKKMVILFDGRDASGKGGTIRRVTRYMNEKRYHVVALGKPNEYQKTELHIKRYIEHFPYAGEIVLFDRSWYNRALVEPVMGFCTQKQYNRFMKKVNTYEQNFIEDEGRTILLKLYFSVSKAEQAQRFDRRKNDPLRLARRETMKVILNRVRYRGRSRKLDFTLDPDIVIQGDRELKIMKKQRKKYGKSLV